LTGAKAVRTLAADLIDLLPPTLTIPAYYRWRTGQWPRNPPRTFSEKVQASKLRPVTPEMVRLADKVAVKELVAERLGPEWVVPTLYAGSRLPARSERDWPIPFVIKAAHGSGWNIFVRQAPDWPEIESQVERWLARKWRRYRGELHYRHMPPRVIVEPMINDYDLPIDYKILVVGGRARFIQLDTGRETEHRQAYYDPNWVKQPITRGFPMDPRDFPTPPNLPLILDAAERMAAGFDFLRVDLYVVNGRPYFGEATFFPGSGTKTFDPPEYEEIIGDMWPWPPGANASR
jgi:hypothetical protein